MQSLEMLWHKRYDAIREVISVDEPVLVGDVKIFVVDNPVVQKLLTLINLLMDDITKLGEVTSPEKLMFATEDEKVTPMMLIDLTNMTIGKYDGLIKEIYSNPIPVERRLVVCTGWQLVSRANDSLHPAGCECCGCKRNKSIEHMFNMKQYKMLEIILRP